MSDTTRLWLIRARHRTPAAVLELCRAAAIGAVVSDSTPRAVAASRALSTSLQLPAPPTSPLTPRSSTEPRAAFEQRLASDLAQLSASSPGVSVAVVANASLVRAVLQLTLALPSASARALRTPPDLPSAVDWPASSDPRNRPALIGISLDWTPPPPSPQRAKFPGGPGSAPSGRS